MQSYGTEDFIDRSCKHCSSLGFREYIDRDDKVNWVSYTCLKCSALKYRQFISEDLYRDLLVTSLNAHKKIYTDGYTQTPSINNRSQPIPIPLPATPIHPAKLVPFGDQFTSRKIKTKPSTTES